jgi:hypothetical protein
VNGRMDCDIELTADELVIVQLAEKNIAEHALIGPLDALYRIQLYARFQDMEIVDVCQAVLAGRIRLLTINETNRSSLPVEN